MGVVRIKAELSGSNFLVAAADHVGLCGGLEDHAAAGSGVQDLVQAVPDGVAGECRDRADARQVEDARGDAGDDFLKVVVILVRHRRCCAEC